MRKVIFYPATRRGNGTGHLVRSLRSARAINSGSTHYRAAVLVGRDDEAIDVASVIAGYSDVPIVTDLAEDTALLVVDRRSVEPDLFEAIPPHTVVIALDEDGPLAENAEYTVRMLGPDDIETNVRIAPPPPERRRLTSPALPGRVLVTFGGEDPARLTLPTVRSLLRAGVRAGSITVVRGPSFAPLELPPGVTVLASAPGLGERLADYDLVVTSYGLTAFEARGAGCRTVTVDPSRYHARQSRSVGFFRLGTRRVSVRRLRRLLAGCDRTPVPRMRRRGPLRVTSSTSSTSSTVGMAGVIETALWGPVNRCPSCGQRWGGAVARFGKATFFRCRSDGLVYRVGTEGSERIYDADYFFTEYRAQYGKTYLEDFDSIRRAASVRLDRIEAAGTVEAHRAVASAPAILDIGCAYGPFLAEARDRGFAAYGIDVVDEAVSYVRDELGIPALRVDLRDFEPGAFARPSFDVVTMWYVIEHFPDLDAVLSRISSMLAPGGIFAFSTPNLLGVSGRSDRRGFLERSPRDHYTVFDPRSAQAVVSRHGFEVIDVRVTGHHPERFPVVGRVAPLAPVLGFVSRRFMLGDTFELYARLTGAHGE